MLLGSIFWTFRCFWEVFWRYFESVLGALRKQLMYRIASGREHLSVLGALREQLMYRIASGLEHLCLPNTYVSRPHQLLTCISTCVGYTRMYSVGRIKNSSVKRPGPPITQIKNSPLRWPSPRITQIKNESLRALRIFPIVPIYFCRRGGLLGLSPTAARSSLLQGLPPTIFCLTHDSMAARANPPLGFT